MPSKLIQVLALTVAAGCSGAQADTPAFDRPGLAFSTSTIPRGALAIELGVPGFVHESSGGSESTTYRLDTNFRTGLGRAVELELATPGYNYARTVAAQHADSLTGTGDLSVSLKAALPAHSPKFSWAMLAGATLVTGAKAFTNGSTQYRLATSLNEQLDDTHAAGLYIELDGSASSSGYTLSPNLGLDIGPTCSGYFEAAYSHASHGQDAGLAGAGLAWMVTPIVQLDLSFDVGLTRASPAVQGGFGFSVYLARL